MQIQRREAESAFTGKGSETESSGLFVVFEVGKSLRFCFSSLSCGSKLVAFVFFVDISFFQVSSANAPWWFSFHTL